MRALGLMSGTSMDGVDLALLDTDGEATIVCGPAGFAPYGEADRSLLRAALAEARGLRRRDERPPLIAEAEARITQLHGDAVRAFLAAHDLGPDAIDLIGFHGQTVLHRPEQRLTVQIGDAAQLAAETGCAVVADFRAADVAAGGQGAPFVPVYHRALAEAAGLPHPLIVVNIGGVANVTCLPGAGADPIAFDTGPGNALIDDLMLQRTGSAVDRDGAAAARGQVDPGVLATLLDHPFFDRPPPKSLDRNAWSLGAVADLSTDDAAATLTAFTAASLARAVDHLPAPPRLAVICGGGGHNPSLMRAIAERLPCETRRADDLGWSIDAIEAQAFAYLAVRSRRGLPLSFPGTTGVPHPMPGGLFVPARP